MYDTIFSKSFGFNRYNFENYKYTDNRQGISSYYFAYMISGHCKISTEKENIYINEGDILFIPYGCKYQSFWYGDPKIEFISLSFLYMPNFDDNDYPVQVIAHNEKAVEYFYKLFDNKIIKANDIGIFYTLVGMLLPSMSYRKKCRTKEIVDQTREFLMEHPFAKTSELAKNCAISESALYSAFQKSSEHTLNNLRNQIIVEKAKEMLISTDTPIEEISEKLQFSSCSYFRKIFKKHLKMSPTKIRKKYRI